MKINFNNEVFMGITMITIGLICFTRGNNKLNKNIDNLLNTLDNVNIYDKK